MEAFTCGNKVPITAPPMATAVPTPTMKAMDGLPPPVAMAHAFQLGDRFVWGSFACFAAALLATGLQQAGVQLANDSWFDTLRLTQVDAGKIHGRAMTHDINLHYFANGDVGISLEILALLGDGVLMLGAM